MIFEFSSAPSKIRNPDQYNQVRQRNAAAQHAVSFVQMREATEVKTQGIGKQDPADHGQHRTRQAGGEALFQVWGQEIEQHNCDHHKTHCQDVAQYRPQQREGVRQAKMAGEKIPEAWADDQGTRTPASPAFR